MVRISDLGKISFGEKYRLDKRLREPDRELIYLISDYIPLPQELQGAKKNKRPIFKYLSNKIQEMNIDMNTIETWEDLKYELNKRHRANKEQRIAEVKMKKKAYNQKKYQERAMMTKYDYVRIIVNYEIWMNEGRTAVLVESGCRATRVIAIPKSYSQSKYNNEIKTQKKIFLEIGRAHV